MLRSGAWDLGRETSLVLDLFHYRVDAWTWAFTKHHLGLERWLVAGDACLACYTWVGLKLNFILIREPGFSFGEFEVRF